MYADLILANTIFY